MGTLTGFPAKSCEKYPSRGFDFRPQSFIISALPTLYDILGVEQSVEPDSLRRAYRKLARKFHPDVNPDPRSHDFMARINEAFATLIDPERRNEYDAMLAGGFGQRTATTNQPKQPMQVRLVRKLSAHKTPVYAITFAPDTGQMITSAFDNEILWWDLEAGEPVRRAKVDAGVVATIRALENDVLVAAGAVETAVGMWTIKRGTVGPYKSDDLEWVTAVAISPDGSSLATGSIHDTMTINTIATGDLRIEREEHEGSVTAVAWSPDGRVVATGAADNTVKLWNASNGDLIHTFKAVRSQVTSMVFSPDGRFLAVAAVDLSIRIFGLAKGSLEKVMFGHTKPIECMAFHPNGWLFASISRDGTVKLWNADKGLGQLNIDASSMPMLTVEFSPDGRYLAAGGLDKLVRVWELSVKK